MVLIFNCIFVLVWQAVLEDYCVKNKYSCFIYFSFVNEIKIDSLVNSTALD